LPGQTRRGAVGNGVEPRCHEQILVPTGIESQLVVREHQRLSLGWRQMAEHNYRYFVHAELLGREQPSVPGDDSILAVDVKIGLVQPNSRIEAAI